MISGPMPSPWATVTVVFLAGVLPLDEGDAGSLAVGAAVMGVSGKAVSVVNYIGKSDTRI